MVLGLIKKMELRERQDYTERRKRSPKKLMRCSRVQGGELKIKNE
jgi:hypothetical protein